MKREEQEKIVERLGGFNQQPKDFKEITEKEFGLLFFHYIFKQAVFKQHVRDSSGNPLGKMEECKIFQVAYPGWEDLGVAIASNGEKLRYYIIGNELEWHKKSSAFAAQFANDNS